MRKKSVVPKLNRNKEYRTPKTLSWERTAEFYGDQRMSMCASNVTDRSVILRSGDFKPAVKREKATEPKKETEGIV